MGGGGGRAWCVCVWGGRFRYIGWLGVDIPPEDRDAVTETLKRDFQAPPKTLPSPPPHSPSSATFQPRPGAAAPPLSPLSRLLPP